jgi:hypothetical protein
MAAEDVLEQIKNKHILVDGDIYAYRCAASAEKTKYLVTVEELPLEQWEYDNHKEAKQRADNWPQPDFTTYIWSRKEVQPVEFALQACKTAIDALLDKLQPSKVSVFLSPDRTFRHDLARTKPYKGNRDQPKPKHLGAVKEYLVKNYGAVYGNNREADDEIGIALSKDGSGSVCVSIDKDLRQVPGWHFNWVNSTVERVTARAGDFHFYTQMLTGDATDNIPGIDGIGPVRAGEILSGAKSSKDLCERVWAIYRGEFNSGDEARKYFLEQAQLLWILRDNPRIPGLSLQYSPPITLSGA